MQYKLKDLQGQGLKEDRVFESKEDVIADLQSFHSIDWEGEVPLDVTLSEMSEQEQLDFLCEHGQWEVVEEEDLGNNGEPITDKDVVRNDDGDEVEQ